MIPAKPTPRNEFPKSPSFTNGMVSLSPRCARLSVRYLPDVPYRQRDGKDLKLQLLLPEPTPQKKPLILFIQGSAWHKQDLYASLPQLSLLAARGYVIASAEYTPSETAPFPAQLLDAKAALRFLRENRETYGFDPDRVFVMGDSSGGHTALMTGLTAGLPELEEDPSQPSTVNGIIDFYGPVDISKMNDELSAMDHIQPDSPEGFLIGRKNVLENPELVFPTVVTNYISAEREIPPILIFHGSNDELVAFGQSCLLYEKLVSCGKEASLYQIEGAHHGGKEFWSDEVLDLVEDFIHRASGSKKK